MYGEIPDHGIQRDFLAKGGDPEGFYSVPVLQMDNPVGVVGSRFILRDTASPPSSLSFVLHWMVLDSIREATESKGPATTGIR